MLKSKLIKGFFAAGISAMLAVSSVPLAAAADIHAVGTFITPTDDKNAVKINENLIEFDIAPYNQFSGNINISTENNIVKGEKTPCEMMDRVTVTLGVQAASGLSNNRLEAINLYVYHTLNGADCPVRSILPSSVVKISDTSYEINYNFITYGTDLRFETAYFSGVTEFSAPYCRFEGKGGDYLKAQATTPDGENLFLSIRNTVDEFSLKKWMKNITMYINSLRDVTGFSRGTMYMLFDDPECPTANSANYKLDSKKEINGFTAFGITATDETLSVMEENQNAITWCVMHELSHSYACHMANNTFDTNYNYHDEVHTNVRGITAICNCENIRNITIYDNGVKGRYNTIYSQRTPDSNDFLFYMAKKMVNIGEEYGWNKLEFFFSADTATSEYDHSYSCETNLEAAAVLKDYLNLDVTVTNPEYLKFVNVLHRLYMLCWDHPTFDMEAFKQFVTVKFNSGSTDDNSGTDLIQRFVCTNIEAPLAITQQPKNIMAEIGDEVSVSVAAEGQNVKYQWYIYEYGESVPTTATIDSPTYTYTLTEENNSRRIYCEISDKYGKTLKTNTVNVGTALKIISQPTNATAELNEIVSTSVSASGTGLKYQWYERNPGTSYWGRSTAKGDTYSCQLTKFRDGREVYCEITDIFGNKIKTRTVTLGVPLEILRQPTNISAPMGGIAKATVKAKGSGLRYRWYIRLKNDIYWYSTSTATPSYSCVMAEETKGSMIYCEITDVFGRKKKTNTILVSEKR